MQLTAPRLVLGLGAAAAVATTVGARASGMGAAGRGEQVTIERTAGLSISSAIVGLGAGGFVGVLGAPRTGAAIAAAGLMIAGGAALGTGLAQSWQGSRQLMT